MLLTPYSTDIICRHPVVFLAEIQNPGISRVTGPVAGGPDGIMGSLPPQNPAFLLQAAKSSLMVPDLMSEFVTVLAGE